MGVMELVRLAYEMPCVFLQLCHDEELARAEEPEVKPTWRRRGEKAAEARDRLRREREETKRRLGVA